MGDIHRLRESTGDHAIVLRLQYYAVYRGEEVGSAQVRQEHRATITPGKDEPVNIRFR
jgi:hypothetical protein